MAVHFAQDRFQWLDFANTTMNFCFHKNREFTDHVRRYKIVRKKKNSVIN
jgi:hypothetical protein